MVGRTSALISVNLIRQISITALLCCAACSPAIEYDTLLQDAGRTIRNVANDGYRTITGDPLDEQLEAENERRVKYPGLLPTAPPPMLEPVPPPNAAGEPPG